MTAPSVLGVIVARGGSKGLPGKNLRPLAGKPLIVHTIEAALGCAALTRTVLSSEDAEILAVGRQAGCPAPFVRPVELAGDRSSTVDVTLHAVDWLARHEGFAADVVVLLPATAPLRRAEHIAGALGGAAGRPDRGGGRRGDRAGLPALLDAHRDGRAAALALSRGSARSTIARTCPAAYRPNGSIYAIHVAALRAQRTFYPAVTAPYVMPREASVNIDAALDFALAELLLARPGR